MTNGNPPRPRPLDPQLLTALERSGIRVPAELIARHPRTVDPVLRPQRLVRDFGTVLELR